MKSIILISLLFPLFLHADDKITLTGPGRAHPKKGLSGGSGEKIILAPGDEANEPYALGLNRGLFWSSVPAGCDFAWFSGGDMRARIDHMGSLIMLPGTAAPGLKVIGTYNGDSPADWDIVIENQKAPASHSLAGFKLSNDGHLEASNKISAKLEDGVTNVSARLSFAGWTSVSDERSKKNIQPLNNSLALVKKLHPVTYQFKWQQDKQTRPGFTAQNVEKVIPGFVEDDGKLKTLNYAALGTVAIGAVKEQQKLIEGLQKENLELKERLDRLEKLFEKASVPETLEQERHK